MSEYTEEVRLKTTEEQDKKAIDAALESAKSWYNAFCNNCSDTVSDALEAAGLNGGTNTSSTANVPVIHPSPIPNVRFDQIKKTMQIWLSLSRQNHQQLRLGLIQIKQ